MKILYGIQGTGKGHESRARCMIDAFKEHSVDIDYVFSGRDKNNFQDMEPFGKYRAFKGFTFAAENGCISIWGTFKQGLSASPTFLKDVFSFDLQGYDLVICDYEPVCAWAVKLHNLINLFRPSKKIKCIGLGNQYAFCYDVPKKPKAYLGKIIPLFAPCEIKLGLHYSQFGQPIIPPILEPLDSVPVQKNMVVIWMDFESLEDVVDLVSPFKDYQFVIYTTKSLPSSLPPHVIVNKASQEGFKRDFSKCAGVISGAGFGISSTAIDSGKHLLVKPIEGQIEHLWNIEALQQAQLGDVMYGLSQETLGEWLKKLSHDSGRRKPYPNVAKAVVSWIMKKKWNTRQELVDSLWNETDEAVVLVKKS